MLVDLIFDSIPKSGNRLKISSKGQYFGMRDYIECWQWRCRFAWAEAGEPVFTCKIRIIPILWKRGKFYDPDNLWQGLKPIIDNFREPKTRPNTNGLGKRFGLGMIKDDGPEFIEHGTPEWHKLENGRQPRMILRIEEVG